MAMTWKLGLLNLSPRLLNFHNPDRVFSDAPSLNSPSGEPPLIPPPHSPSLSSLIQAKLAKFSGFGETGRDERGPFSKSLHRERLEDIRSSLCAHFRLFSAAPSPPGEPPSIPPPRSPSPPSKIQAELAKFSAIAQTWLDAGGPIKFFHRSRVNFIREWLCHHFRRDPLSARPFEGLKFIVVGCGSGILSEPLARMGATVMGVDCVEKKIKIARLHADLDPVTSRIEYHCTTAENLVEEQKSFDAVLALEVIEQVSNPSEFCKSLSALTVPNGAIMISATAANPIAIIVDECLLHWQGTPQRLSDIDPDNLVQFLERTSISDLDPVTSRIEYHCTTAASLKVHINIWSSFLTPEELASSYPGACFYFSPRDGWVCIREDGLYLMMLV